MAKHQVARARISSLRPFPTPLCSRDQCGSVYFAALHRPLAASRRRRRFSRSASLESRATAAARSRSLDTEDTAAAASDPAPQYRVLADYAPAAPGAGRQLQLCEGALVRLVKIGCAGWWFVRAQDGGEGWAPSTYLQLLPNTKTLDRK